MLGPRTPKDQYQKTAMIAAFFDELENIEKEAGWLKNMAVTGGLLGALGGGAKMMPKAVAGAAHTLPAVTQVVKHAPSTMHLGGTTNSVRDGLRLAGMGS